MPREGSHYRLMGDLYQVREAIERIAPTDTPVLITGETGTGKELVAREIHRKSRNRCPFVLVPCGTLRKDTAQSDLFGHVNGAYTGTVGDRVGYFELADKGSIFLDDISTMSSSAQEMLLRVIEYRDFRRMGANKTLHTNARVLAATNEPLEEKVAEGAFRKDLFHRLDIFRIYVPPLREREDDIPKLVEYFIEGFSKKLHISGKIEMEDGFLDMLRSYDWPGNVRQLRNAIEYALIMYDGEALRKEHAAQKLEMPSKRIDLQEVLDLKEVERRTIMRALIITGNNKAKAAKLLGIPHSSLYRKMKRLGIPLQPKKT